MLPAESGPDLEQRADVDREPRFLAHLARERILDALAGVQVATEETPLRRAEAVAREDHGAARIDAEPDDPDQEPRLRAVEDPPLPADREPIEDERERAHEH